MSNPSGLSILKNKYEGKTAIVVGNGPSLRDIPLAFLKSYPSFGSNRIWMLFQPTFYVCTDPLDAQKNRKQIHEMTVPKFIRWGWGEGYPIEVILKSDDPGWNHFTPDPTKPMYDGCTVTFVALELAYWMGFANVLLVGVDHRYMWNGAWETVQHSNGDDPNHFLPNYHLPNEIWQPPNLARMEKGYMLARDAFAKAGRRIINLTPNSALNVFPQSTIAEWMQ